MKNIDEILELGIKEASSTMEKNFGGPFGAVILNKAGEVISIASNTVLKDNDPTAHAEINAIRKAGQKLGTYDLSDCILYTTCYPCPMCLGAIIWSNIKEIYYGCTKEDAAKIGFRDDFIYEFIKKDCNDDNVIKITPVNKENCIKLFEKYEKDNKVIY